MTPLSRRALVAVATVVEVALHARPTPISARTLAARHDLGPRHLESILNALVRAGILRGVRGPRGGYELARERRRISVGDVVRAAGAEGADPGLRPSSLLAEVVGPAMDRAALALMAELDGLSVDALCAEARRLEIPGAAQDPDFTI